ncbi:glucose dehydrogenase [FAD, quinone]-like [Ctenocephalides felis]|uniref:glucose dehydrogenase [FAD, quinone]-like n=1 Tax=Ctenocephalides felis TaxID=7515 RepID=UPI000E6E1676|nr:glucose dehydrogenase [FAD, quinone]-like [Ctenocephalides felis]
MSNNSYPFERALIRCSGEDKRRVMSANIDGYGVRVRQRADAVFADVSTQILEDYYNEHEASTDKPIPTIDQFEDVYDFIIIGSGPGGSVMANRLTEVNNWKVLLLEAGEQSNYLSDVPLLAGNLIGTSFDWNYESVKQNGSCLARNGYCDIASGKVLGGSSILNFVLYSRGNKKDYDRWCDAGNHGWCYKDALKYFKKSEKIHIENLKNSIYHGTEGYLSVDYPGYETNLSRTFIEAGLELGYETNDYNGLNQTSVAKLQTNLKNGRRCSAVNCYLKPASTRPNLSISTSAFVTKILFNNSKNRVVGVYFTKNGTNYKIRARKEVILSAGTFNSPKVLMLSGIGPSKHLQSLGIPVVKDLKVGYNYRNHFGIMPLEFEYEGLEGIGEDVLENPEYVEDYFKNGKGPITLPSGMEALSLMNTKFNNKKIPDVEVVLFTLVAFQLAPKPVGRVKLASRDPMEPPIINPNYLSNEHDIKVMIEALKLAIKMIRTKAFSKYNVTLNSIPHSKCKNFTSETDEYWECALRSEPAKWVQQNDSSAVVDHRLKVHGISGLRVVDASIMPTLPAAHTTAVVYMIAEKAADMVKEDWLGDTRNKRLNLKH